MPSGRPQLLEPVFGGGLSQKSDLRSAQPSEAITMQNLVRLKNGAVRKRFGATALSNSGTDVNAVSMRAGGNLIASGSSLAMTGGRSGSADGSHIPYGLQSYSDALSTWGFVGFYPNADVLDRQGLATFPSNPTDYDAVLGTNGVLVVVALVDNALWWAAYDASGASPTYACLRALSTRSINFTGGGISPRLIACGTTAILVYVINSSTVNCQSLDLTNLPGGWSAQQALTLSASQPASLGNGFYDVAPVDGDASRFAMAFETSASTNSAAIAIYSTTSPFTQSKLVLFETRANFATFKSICLQATNAAYYWMGYVATTGASVGGVAGVARVGFWKETGNITGTPGTALSIATGNPIGHSSACVTAVSGTEVLAFSTGYASNAANAAGMNSAFIQAAKAVDTAGTVVCTSNGGVWHGVQLASRLIYEPTIDITGQGVVCAVYIPSSAQGTHYTVSLDGIQSGNVNPGRPLSCLAPRLSKNMLQPMAGSANMNLRRMFNMPAALGSGDVYAFPMTLAVETFHNAIFLQFVELLPRKVPLGADRSGQTLMTGGVPWQFDGQYLNEPNFLLYPEIGVVTPSNAGGSLGTGVYQFLAVWEWYDARGNLHQSAGSPIVSPSVTGPTGSVQLQVPCPALGYRLDQQIWSGTVNVGVSVPPPRVVIYRTTVNGTLFYRDTADPAPTANNAAVGGAPLTITSTQSDANLTAAATAQLWLPTTSGQLDNFNPPASRCRTIHKSRFWLAGCDEPTQVWPSSPFITGVCPGWNEAIAFNATGAVRALESLDDKLILFVQRGQQFGIEYVTGDGPTNVGTQSDWSQPQAIASDVGAVDQRSVCSGPFGILFRSPVGGPNGTGGIHLLTRDLQVQYISGPVEDTLASNPIMTSMVVHPNAGRVYITCVQAEGVSPLVGVRLVWDYIQGCWSTDAVSDPDNSQTGVAGARHAVVANTPSGPTYHWLSATGRVYRETAGTGANSYTDAGTWITATLTSSPQKLGQSTATKYFAVQIQADSLDPADLTATLTYDYAPSSFRSTTKLYTAAVQAAMERFPQVDVELQPVADRLKAVQVTLTDAPPTGGPTATTGQGFSWANPTIEVAQDGESLRYQNLSPSQRG